MNKKNQLQGPGIVREDCYVIAIVCCSSWAFMAIVSKMMVTTRVDNEEQQGWNQHVNMVKDAEVVGNGTCVCDCGKCRINHSSLFRIVTHVMNSINGMMDVELMGKKIGRMWGTWLYWRVKRNISEWLGECHGEMICVAMHCEPSLFCCENWIFLHDYKNIGTSINCWNFLIDFFHSMTSRTDNTDDWIARLEWRLLETYWSTS